MKSIFSPTTPKKPEPVLVPVQETSKIKLWMLEDLYNELGQIQWHLNEKGWDAAVDSVRKRIREMIVDNKGR